MNCQEFESNVEGLARGALYDSRARAEATAHEEACPRCAARLADERALTSALRSLASSMKEAQTPARVEASLLADFRARAGRAADTEVSAPVAGAGVVGAADSTGNVVPLHGRASLKGWSWAKTLAVASLAAAAAAVALFMLIPPFVSAPAEKTNAVAGNQAGRNPQSDTTRGAGSNVTPTPDDRQLASAPDDAGPQPSPTARDKDMAPRATPPRRATIPVRASNVDLRKNDGGGVPRPGDEIAGEANAAEITTDFIPLIQGGRLVQSDGGHLVRVELPRSALVSFGLPVNFERAGGRVKADVLLGDDGIAHAIRFVR